jgi:hypothetical protein
MNPQLQPRTHPMLAHAYPVCAFSDFDSLRLRSPAHPTIAPKYIRCQELPARTRSPHANPGLRTLQNQLARIQRP